MNRLPVCVLAIGLVTSITPARADLPEPLLPAPLPGIPVRLVPLVQLPAENNGTGSASGVEFVVPVLGSNALFASSTNGTIYRTSTSGAAPTVWLDLTNPPAGTGVGFSYLFNVVRETGLTGIAFDPNFDGDPTKPGYGVFYTASTVQGTPVAPMGGGSYPYETVIQQWTNADPNAASFSGTSRTVTAIGAELGSHNVYTIAFNPTAVPGSADYGNLYISVGDGLDPTTGGQFDPRSLGSTAGKILRIHPTIGAGQPYTIPSDNPFVGVTGAQAAVWAYGLRNPESISWDRATGQMYIDDIGENSAEEVDLGVAGANYGWPLREGTFAEDPATGGVLPLPADDALNGFTYPVSEYDHSVGNAIGTGFVDESTVIPELTGKYVFSDIPDGKLFYFDPAEGSPGDLAPISQIDILNALGDPLCLACDAGYPRADLRLAQDDPGNIYAYDKADGEIYSLASFENPVPEPGGIAMLTGALGLLMTLRRRRPASRVCS